VGSLVLILLPTPLLLTKDVPRKPNIVKVLKDMSLNIKESRFFLLANHLSNNNANFNGRG
jgi:hypothetical protein